MSDIFDVYSATRACVLESSIVVIVGYFASREFPGVSLHPVTGLIPQYIHVLVHEIVPLGLFFSGKFPDDPSYVLLDRRRELLRDRQVSDGQFRDIEPAAHACFAPYKEGLSAVGGQFRTYFFSSFSGDLSDNRKSLYSLFFKTACQKLGMFDIFGKYDSLPSFQSLFYLLHDHRVARFVRIQFRLQ